jgi:hypothetical protein
MLIKIQCDTGLLSHGSVRLQRFNSPEMPPINVVVAKKLPWGVFKQSMYSCSRAAVEAKSAGLKRGAAPVYSLTPPYTPPTLIPLHPALLHIYPNLVLDFFHGPSQIVLRMF